MKFETNFSISKERYSIKRPRPLWTGLIILFYMIFLLWCLNVHWWRNKTNNNFLILNFKKNFSILSFLVSAELSLFFPRRITMLQVSVGLFRYSKIMVNLLSGSNSKFDWGISITKQLVTKSDLLWCAHLIEYVIKAWRV